MRLFTLDAALVLADWCLFLWASLLVGFAAWYVWSLRGEDYDGLY